MALTLTPGSESRLDGAPNLPLPAYADLVDSVARKLVEMDADGALYGGDPSNARADSRDGRPPPFPRGFSRGRARHTSRAARLGQRFLCPCGVAFPSDRGGLCPAIPPAGHLL